MELLWIGLFAVLCVGIGALVIACDRLAPTEPPAHSTGSP
jgi:hypothetical protein